MYQTILYKYTFNENIEKIYRNILSFLNDRGSLFVFFENEYNSERFVEKSFFDVIDLFLNLNFQYVDTIVYPIKSNYFTDTIRKNVGYIIWFTRDINTMFFDKDKIREKHIWKDVEWGKRKKNYNPKGKDPGNVWIPTKDNGKGIIIDHIILPTEEIVNRCIVATTTKDSKVFIKIPNIDKTNISNNGKVTYQKCLPNNNEKKYLTKYPKKNTKKDFKPYSIIYFKTSENMYDIEDNTIDLMITSPPYWNLKNYFKKGQIGHESYDKYLERIHKVWQETFRVLKNSGNMWININTRKRNKIPILIPRDIIIQCKKIGFLLKEIIIWHKSSGIPVNKQNIVDRHEYLLWFTKTNNFKINNIGFNDYKNIHLSNGQIWNINRKAGSVGKDFIHPAIYPNKLVERIINICSDEGDVILDPFLGSGTTAISALNNNRNSVGYEYAEIFHNVIKYRIDKEVKNNKEVVKYNGLPTEIDGNIFRN